jgi:hypothetical protein
MRVVRRIGWVGLAAGGAALVLGLVLVVGSAITAGDWSLARQPWIGVGLTLLVFGHAVTSAFALLLVIVEPLGWRRLIAIPPALFVGAFWGFTLAVGVPTTGGPEFDVGTALYSMPPLLAMLVVATGLIALPLVTLRRHAAPDDDLLE